MRQPLIDPVKVDAWAASVRGVFAYDQIGTWIVVGFALAFLALVIVAAVKGGPKTHY
jgi:hypothetical protein